MRTVPISHGRGRGGLVWLGRIAIFIGGLILLGSIYMCSSGTHSEAYL